MAKAVYIDQFRPPGFRWLPCQTRSIPSMSIAPLDGGPAAGNSVRSTQKKTRPPLT